MPPYKIIIFDWDGTLADSTTQILNAIFFAFNQLKLTPPPIEELKKIIGLPLSQCYHLFFPVKKI